MLGESTPALHQRAEHRRARSRATTASRPSRCIIRRRSRRACTPAPFGDYVLSVGRLEDGQAGRPRSSARWRTSTARVRLVVVGDGTAARSNSKRCAAEAGVEIASTLLGAVDDEQLVELYRGRARRRLSAVRRGLRLRDARGVSRAQAGDHRRRRGRPARVREDGVNGFVCRRSPIRRRSPARWRALSVADREPRAAALGEHGWSSARAGRSPGPASWSS